MAGKIKTSSDDRIFYGVSGAVAEKFNIPSILVRLLFIFTTPVSVFVYFTLLYFVFDDGYI
ncbi:PspC domain-containing protein [Corticicoccus populi]|uniref:PspC domain-containing protein n=1 Tax=Corticicoccus populi TaxID=1812821 RepID=A0ABW5WWA2_9STAP